MVVWLVLLIDVSYVGSLDLDLRVLYKAKVSEIADRFCFALICMMYILDKALSMKPSTIIVDALSLDVRPQKAFYLSN